MQRLLIVDYDPRSRLGWLDALREHFEIDVGQRGEIPVRRVRSGRPAVVVLSLARGRLQETLRWSRTIKTDSDSPPPVGIFDPGGRIRVAEEALETAMADGLLRGEAPMEARREFVLGLLRGDGERVQEFPVRSLRQRIFGG
jgi:hypothetical protein